MTTNVFACLVHEAPDCVLDLVANLRCLDPESTVLLYDGSVGRVVLRGLEWLDHRVVVVPSSRPMAWGRLHDFALDCMRHALETLTFDTLTVVDSDQLLLRPGYSDRVRQLVADHPSAGCFGSDGGPLPRGTHIYPAAQMWEEYGRWLPYLERRFPGRTDLFPHFSFWPSTVFTADACRRLVRAWEDPELHQLVSHTKVVATEEVLLPSLTALAGLDVVRTPLRQDVVGFRRDFHVAEVARMADHPDAFWIHPVPRVIDHPLRAWVRERFHRYADAANSASTSQADQVPPGMVSGLLVTGDRPHEAAFAVRQWELQDHQQRELVILDIGDRPVDEALRACPGVEYVRPPARTGRAGSLNLAASHARGDYFAHWDESAWIHPSAMSDSLRALADQDADLVGRRSFVGYDESCGTAWSYEYPSSRQLWLADFTLVYHRSVWEAQPFTEAIPDSQIGYYWPARARRAIDLHGLPPHVRALGLAQPAEPWWQPLPAQYLPGVLGPDWSSYVATREPA